MRRAWLFILVFGLAHILSAQESSMVIDLHGGTTTIIKGSNPFGVLGGFGMRYQCLFPQSSQLKLGVATGLSFDYAQMQYSTKIDRSFTMWDTYHNEIDYTMTGGYKESFQQLRFQVPVLFAIRTYGLTINLGVGVSGWKQLTYKEQWNEPHLTAYYPAYEVTIEDADPSGLLTEDDYRRSLGMRDLTWNVMAIGEVGYEWKMGLNNGLGVQALVQYGVWSTCVPVLDLGLKVYYRFGMQTTRRRGDCHCM